MNTDPFTLAARAEAEQYGYENAPTIGTTALVARAHLHGWEAARAYLAAQEPADAEALRRLSEDASGGPWGAWGQYVSADGGHDGIAEMCTDADAAFIAATRTAVPALLDENAALRARIKAVRELASEEDECGDWVVTRDTVLRALDGNRTEDTWLDR